MHSYKKPRFVPGASSYYSEAGIAQNLVFIAGQASIDLATQQVVSGTVEEETRRTLENMKVVLEQAGSCMENVLKVLLLVESLDYFDTVNRVYEEYFPQNPPARSTIETRLPGGVKVEMEAVAMLREEAMKS